VGTEDASVDTGVRDGTLDTTPPAEGGEAATPPPDSGDAGTQDTGAMESAVPESGVDSASEAAAEASTPCSGLTCNGQCTTATDCHACPGSPLLCAPKGQCTAGCEACVDSTDASLPIDCFACDSSHENPIGTCQYNDAGSYCLNGSYAGQYDGGPGYRCSCTDVTGCPGATQVCVPLGNVGASFCLTCGEITLATIQGQPCHDGGTCQAGLAACQ
jgi:hypothetical protein